MHFKQVLVFGGIVFAHAAYADIDRGKEAYFMGDYDRAIAEFTEDADNGNSYAEIKLGFMHENGWGTAKDFNKAREFYSRAAEHGDAEGYIHLAKLNAYARGQERDADIVRDHLVRAAAIGSSHAYYVLGEVFNDPYAFGEHPKEALNWYLMAAENDAAAYLVNGHYRPGKGQWFRLISPEGVKLTQEKADLGNQYAQFNTGLRYHFGEGVGTNYDIAEKYFIMAARQGNVEAQKFVAQNRARNTEKNSDLVFIDTWLTIASLNGDKEATRNKAKMEVNMSADQIAEAEKAAREWVFE